MDSTADNVFGIIGVCFILAVVLIGKLIDRYGS